MKDKGRRFKIIAGIFLLVGSLWLFLSDGSLLQLVPSILGAYFILEGAFSMIKAYYIPKNGSYLSMSGLGYLTD